MKYPLYNFEYYSIKNLLSNEISFPNKGLVLVELIKKYKTNIRFKILQEFIFPPQPSFRPCHTKPVDLQVIYENMDQIIEIFEKEFAYDLDYLKHIKIETPIQRYELQIKTIKKLYDNCDPSLKELVDKMKETFVIKQILGIYDKFSLNNCKINDFDQYYEVLALLGANVNLTGDNALQSRIIDKHNYGQNLLARITQLRSMAKYGFVDHNLEEVNELAKYLNQVISTGISTGHNYLNFTDLMKIWIYLYDCSGLKTINEINENDAIMINLLAETYSGELPTNPEFDTMYEYLYDKLYDNFYNHNNKEAQLFRAVENIFKSNWEKAADKLIEWKNPLYIAGGFLVGFWAIKHFAPPAPVIIKI